MPRHEVEKMPGNAVSRAAAGLSFVGGIPVRHHDVTADRAISLVAFQAHLLSNSRAPSRTTAPQSTSAHDAKPGPP